MNNIIDQFTKSFYFGISGFWQFSSIILFIALGFLGGFIYRAILKSLSKNQIRKSNHNINNKDRWLRAIFGLLLLILAIFYQWSPSLLFFAGFCFFEAIFSWCGFYAALGKSSCPL